MSEPKIQIKLDETSKSFLRDIARSVKRGSDPATRDAKLVLSRLSGYDSETDTTLESPGFKNATQALNYITPLVKALRGERSGNKAIFHAIDEVLHAKWGGSPEAKKVRMNALASQIAEQCSNMGITIVPTSLLDVQSPDQSGVGSR